MKVSLKFFKSKSLWLALVAVSCGVAATLSARQYIGEQLAAERAKNNPAQTMVDVVVAKKDMRVGDSVVTDNMAIRQVPAQYVSSQAIRPTQFDALDGSRLAVAMKSGEVLQKTSIAGSEVASFSHRVRPGVRAMTVTVDEVNSISGLLQPGDRVDLLFSTKNPFAGSGGSAQLKQDVTLPFMHNVVILATGKQLRPGDDGKTQRQFTTITIEAEPEQAQRLVVAQRSGKLTAMLRNPDDRAPLLGKAMDLESLINVKKTVIEAPPPAPVGPQIIVGGNKVLEPAAQGKAAQAARTNEELDREAVNAPAASKNQKAASEPREVSRGQVISDASGNQQ